MKNYLELLEKILEKGDLRSDRTGVGTLSLFTEQLRFDLSKGFPAVTTKKLAWKSVVSELLWFLEGSTDERRLAEILYNKDRSELIGKNTIWTANADNQGVVLGYINTDLEKQLGPIYGYQWNRNQQIDKLIENIKTDPYSRRHIVSSWNVDQIDSMSLPPCHMIFQFHVVNNTLSCHMFQRSCDMFLGVPFNIASYALLTHMIAQITEKKVGELILTLGDAHIYSSHLDQVKQQLERTPFSLPKLWLNPNIKDIHSFKMDDIKLLDYKHHYGISAEMAV